MNYKINQKVLIRAAGAGARTEAASQQGSGSRLHINDAALCRFEAGAATLFRLFFYTLFQNIIENSIPTY
jgi:hypothetical protein